MERFITRFSRVYTPFVVVIALATAIIPSLVSGNWEHWIYTAWHIPCYQLSMRLVLSVPLSFFSGIGLGSRQGILFKGGTALEALKNVKAIIMDKTGTITEGNFVLQSILPYSKESEDTLLAYAAACEPKFTHPIAKSILTAADDAALPYRKYHILKKSPAHGITAQINDRIILCGNQKLINRYGIDLPAETADYGTEVFPCDRR